MKRTDTLKEFLRHSVALIGAGYTNILITKIPEHKEYVKETIYFKITRSYNTNTTRSQRYYAKKKGYANFQAVTFRNFILILHTKGKIAEDTHKGNGFIDFEKKNRITIPLTKYLIVDIFRDERKKLTVKLNTETYRNFKNEFDLAYKTRSGFSFHNIIKKLSNLPPYRGIQLQKIEMVKYLRQRHKDYGVKWTIPTRL